MKNGMQSPDLVAFPARQSGASLSPEKSSFRCARQWAAIAGERSTSSLALRTGVVWENVALLQAREGLRALSGRRVAVVGAGPGGLATALLLARAGIHVTLFEKDGQVGGRTKTVEAPGGYKFDIGPTFFLYPQILADIFNSCGERLEDHVKLERLDPQYHLVFEGRTAFRARSAPPATSTGWKPRSPASPRTTPRT